MARCAQVHRPVPPLLQPVDRAALLRQRGRLAPSEVERLATRLRTYLGLWTPGRVLCVELRPDAAPDDQGRIRERTYRPQRTP